MIRRAFNKIHIYHRVPAIILFLALCASLAVGIALGIQYIVNTLRSPDYWVEYYEVRPVTPVFNTGDQPKFYSKAEWFVAVNAAWYDRMWCTADTGVFAGMTIRINSPTENKIEKRYPRKVGFLNEDGKTDPGDLMGFWEWDGSVPRVHASCWLEPRLKIFPSLGVEKDVPIEPTDVFFFFMNGFGDE